MKIFRNRLRMGLIAFLALIVIAAGVMVIIDPKIDNDHIGAGGHSQGGGYTLTGSIGQPEVGVISGGGYTLSGGLWGGMAETPPSLGEHSIFLPLVIK